MRRLASTSIPVRSSHSPATIVLTVVAFIATALTSLKIGPVRGLGDRYGLPDELVIGYLQLFLLDCGLILLPLGASSCSTRAPRPCSVAAPRKPSADVAASATPRRLWQLRAGCSRMGLTSIPLS